MEYFGSDLETAMTDVQKSIEERMGYFLDEVDAQFGVGEPLPVQLYFDAVSDIYVSSLRHKKDAGRDITRTDQIQYARLKNMCVYLEDCLRNPDIAWFQPDNKLLRNFWNGMSQEDYLPFEELN